MRTIITITFILIHAMSYSQSGIGRKAARGALDVNNTSGNNTSGIVLPTTDDVNKILNPQGGTIAPGTLIYDSKNDCIRYFIAKTNSWSECIATAPKVPFPDLTANCTGILLDNYDNRVITESVNNISVTSTLSYDQNIINLRATTEFCGAKGAAYRFGAGNRPSTLTIKFNKKVTNLKIYQLGSNQGEKITFIAKLNGQTVTNTSIVPAQVSCNEYLSINGMSVEDIVPTPGYVGGQNFIYIVTGGWFDEITMTHNGFHEGSNLKFCIGSAKEL